jgi:hypothetical protein
MKKLSLLVVVVGVLFGVQAASAFAAEVPYVALGPVFDQAADGQPVHQQRIAVNRATDRVYVTDVIGDQIRVFDPTVAGAIEGTAFGSGEVSDPLGVAVDQETGAIYVSDADNVVKYASDGLLDLGFISPPGVTGAVAFDQNADELVVADIATNVVRRYSPTGIPGATFDGSDGGSAFTGLQDIAIAPSGDIYVVDANGDPAIFGYSSHVERYSAAGQHQASVGAGAVPATVAVNATGDRVVVSANQQAVFADDAPTLSVFDTADLSLPVQQLDRSGLSFDTIRGLAIDDGPTTRLYVATDNGRFSGDMYGTTSLRVYARILPPALTVAAPSDITATGAQLSGTVNPNSAEATYRFEYSADDGASWQPVDVDASVGAGDSAVAVQASLGGLLPASAYRVRLVASNLGGTTQSSSVSFTTAEVPATVTTGTVTERGMTSATLRGSVNPHGLQTSYHFDYGTTAAYGSRFPAGGDLVAGKGQVVREIARGVSGLQPGTTYHFRLAATNSLSTVNGDDHTFTTDAAGTPVRGYEMVSPVDNGGVGVGDALNGVKARADGNAVVYSVDKAPYPDTGGAPLDPKALGTRGEDGWSSESLDVPTTHDSTPQQQILKTVVATSEDLRKTLVASLRSLGGQGIEGNGNLYVYDTQTALYTLVATSADPEFFNRLSGTVSHGAVVGVASDLSTVAFVTTSVLTPDAVGDNKVYVWSASEGLRFAGVNFLFYADPSLRRANQVSADGARVYLDGNGTSPRVVSLYEDGQVFPVSASHRQGDPPDHLPGLFQAASEDGRYAIFKSTYALTDDANPPAEGEEQLYRYDAETRGLTFLAGGMRDGYFLAARPETSEGYFLSRVPQAGATGPSPYLYRFDGSTVSFVAALGEYPLNFLLSPSGRYLVFLASAKLTPYDNAGSVEVYLYDGQTGSLVCPSCRSDGGLSTGWARIGQLDVGVSDWQRYFAQSVTDDGQVFFDTPDPLVAGDVNGVRDVYSYQDGRVSLISRGTQGRAATFLDATPSGNDVFFVTDDRLVGQDDNATADLYDARIGGGIAAQSPKDAPASCGGPECREPDGGLGSPLAATQTIAPAPDGPARRVRARVSIVRVSSTPRALRVTVAVSGRGRIRAAGAGISPVSRAVGRAGRYTLRLPLTRDVRRSRRARHHARVTVTVSLKPQFGATTTIKLARTLGK